VAIRPKDPKTMIEHYFHSDEMSKSFDFSVKKHRNIIELLRKAQRVQDKVAPVLNLRL
jgi:hypothetical protein